MKKLALFLAAFMPALGFAAIKSQTVEYKQGKATLQGFLVWDDAVQGKRPGILVAHAWKGLDDFTRSEATKLAQMGYVAFALDVYGKGIRPTSMDECAKISGTYKNDRPLLRARAKAGLDQLLKVKNVDPEKIGAIGFCFGGATVLELARSGAPVKGTVVFHGSLSTPTPQDAANIKGKVLALHGGDDPFVKKEEVDAFVDEMKKGKVDWQLNLYGGAVHGFMEPGNGNDNATGLAYNQQAATRAWKAMSDFFDEVFRTSTH